MWQRLTCFVIAGLIKDVWLLVSHYHSFQSASTMASSQPLPWLPVSYYHGLQSAAIMASNQLIPWLPVSHYHGFQSATIMAFGQPLPWLPVSQYHGCCCANLVLLPGKLQPKGTTLPAASSSSDICYQSPCCVCTGTS